MIKFSTMPDGFWSNAPWKPRVRISVPQMTGTVYRSSLPLITIFLCNFARRRRRRNASSVYITTSCLECPPPTPAGWMLVTMHLPGSATLLAKWTCWALFKWAKKFLRRVDERIFRRSPLSIRSINESICTAKDDAFCVPGVNEAMIREKDIGSSPPGTTR